MSLLETILAASPLTTENEAAAIVAALRELPYAEAECSICQMVATDRDDALAEAGHLTDALRRLHEINGWRAGWMDHASSAMNQAVQLLEDQKLTDADSVDLIGRMGALIAEEWGDGDDDDEDDE